jgi:hypothetical protein
LFTLSNARDDGLPPFPRPDLPESHPLNFPTLQLRVRRRRGMPDDGRLRLHDAIAEDVLIECNGVVTSDTEHGMLLTFTSLSNAIAWAEAVTETNDDRQLVRFAAAPLTPYQPVPVIVYTAVLECACCGTTDLIDRETRWATSPVRQVDYKTLFRCGRCRAVLCDSCATPPEGRHDRPGTEQECT